MKEWPTPFTCWPVSTVERALCEQERPCGEEVATGSAVSTAVQLEDSIRVPRLPNKAGGSFCLDRGNRNFSGCVWLRICGNSAVFFTRLHRQVLDLLDWPEGQMKFETRHSPHSNAKRSYSDNRDVQLRA